MPMPALKWRGEIERQVDAACAEQSDNVRHEAGDLHATAQNGRPRLIDITPDIRSSAAEQAWPSRQCLAASIHI